MQIEKLVSENREEEALKLISKIRLENVENEDLAFWIYLNDEPYPRDDETPNYLIATIYEKEYGNTDDLCYHYMESAVECLTEDAKDKLIRVVEKFNKQKEAERE